MKTDARSKAFGSGCKPGERKPRRTRRPASETRKDILKTAEKLFRERGYQQVAMADIATELNMSPANVFKHFHAKSALVDAIACAHIEDMMADLKGIDPAASPERKILDAAERLLAVLLRDVSANPHIFEMVVLCVDPSRTAGDFYREKISAVLQVFIDEGVRKGQFHVRDSGHTASVLATALGGILNPLVVCHEEPDILYTRCRDLVDLVILALQNPLAK